MAESHLTEPSKLLNELQDSPQEKGYDVYSAESVEEAPSRESEHVIRGAEDITNLVSLTTGGCAVCQLDLLTIRHCFRSYQLRIILRFRH